MCVCAGAWLRLPACSSMRSWRGRLTGLQWSSSGSMTPATPPCSSSRHQPPQLRLPRHSRPSGNAEAPLTPPPSSLPASPPHSNSLLLSCCRALLFVQCCLPPSVTSPQACVLAPPPDRPCPAPSCLESAPLLIRYRHSTSNSSLEGAMKLKFVAFCSS